MLHFFQTIGQRKTIRWLEAAAMAVDQGDAVTAMNYYQKILASDPLHPVALNEVGRMYLQQKNYCAAINVFETFLAVCPDIPLAHHNLGVALCGAGRLVDGFAHLKQHAQMVYGTADDAMSMQDPRIARHKKEHDREQWAYVQAKAKNDPIPRLSQAEHGFFQLMDAPSLAAGALNKESCAAAYKTEWAKTNPKIMVVDDFLSPGALQSLRDFFWSSTVWHRVYEQGYLGALPEYGLGTPLLAQIIDELRVAFPDVVGDLPLCQFWAFKYDYRCAGVNLHADCAAVNVNFWLAPDDANVEPDHGGLILWDKPAPLDWDFTNYNQNEQRGRAYLAEVGARSITVPHRSNRAVLFDSNLFHETDCVHFKPIYTHRRINVTLLFGHRGL